MKTSPQVRRHYVMAPFLFQTPAIPAAVALPWPKALAGLPFFLLRLIPRDSSCFPFPWPELLNTEALR